MVYGGVVGDWVDESCGLWYVGEREKGKEYVKVDGGWKKGRGLFEEEKMGGGLREKGGGGINGYKVGVENWGLNI